MLPRVSVSIVFHYPILALTIKIYRSIILRVT